MTEETNIPDKLDFKYIFINLLYYINDSLFYAFIIQVILVTYGYFSVGKNMYWRVLCYSSWFGLLGAIIEKLCKIWTEHPDNTNQYIYILYIINEPFWIISEYTIPYVNMIKLSAIISRKKVIILRIYIGLLFIIFVIFRFRIGIIRYKEQEVFNNKIYHAHGFSFLTLAVAELSCTLLILRRLSIDFKIAKRKGHSGNIYNYSRQSSFFILLVVDICGFILAILSLISNYTFKAFLVIFHCLKSNFVLILAFDALIFKIENMEISNNAKQSKNNSSNIFTSTNDNFNEQSNSKLQPINIEITPCNMECNKESVNSTKSDDLKKIYKNCQGQASDSKTLKQYNNVVILENDEINVYNDDNDDDDDIDDLNKKKSNNTPDMNNNKKKLNVNKNDEVELKAIYSFSNTIIGNDYEKYNNMRTEAKRLA